MNYGVYVKGEDGTEHLRPDQLVPVLWKAVQELSAIVTATNQQAVGLQAELVAIKFNVDRLMTTLGQGQ